MGSGRGHILNVELIFHPLRQAKAKRERKRCNYCHKITDHRTFCGKWTLNILSDRDRYIKEHGSEDAAIQWLIQKGIAHDYSHLTS
jgi:hypothetical protein